MIMESWAELCNMRSSLLHLQMLYCSLSERISEQRSRIDRAHKDRLMQYSALWEEFTSAEHINFKRLVIMKLEACLNLYGNDEQVWNLMDDFISYAEAVEHDLMDNISKLYLGKRVMMDIREVEEQLAKIEEKIVAFLNANQSRITQYNSRMAAITETRKIFSSYLKQIRAFYEEISKEYYAYLSRKLQARMKELDKSVQTLKDAIFR